MGANQPTSMIPASNLQLLSARDYNIPIYQRPYCWERNNIERLLNDIEEARLKNSAASYYIGNIITSAPLNNNGTIFENTQNIDILDGQQRFTTLTMIAAYLRVNDDSQSQKTSKLILQLDDHESLAFEDLLQGKLKNWNDSPNLPKEIQRAAEVIINWFKTKEIDECHFKEYLLKQVKFFEINLSALIKGAENKTIATINYYDNLNTSGKQLEPLDVFKGLLFAKLDRNDAIEAASIWNSAFNQRSSIEPSEHKEHTTLEELLKADNSKGSSSDNNETQNDKRFRLVKDWELVALAHYSIVGSKNGYFSPGELLPKAIVNSYNDASTHKPFEFIERLRLLDGWLSTFFINSDIVEDGEYQDQYYLPQEEGGKNKDVDTTIKNLSLLQFLLHSIYNSNPHVWLQPLINELVEPPGAEVNFEKILSTLERQQIKKLRTLNTLTENGLPTIQYGEDRVRLYLTMVEYAMAQQPPSQKVRRTIGRSIEHIYPQNWGEDETDANGVKLHTIYNLALLTANRNSGYGDLSFEQKRQVFNSDYNKEYKESLRLAEYYSSDKNISATRKDFESIALSQHETLVKWANGVPKTTDQ